MPRKLCVYGFSTPRAEALSALAVRQKLEDVHRLLLLYALSIQM